MRKYNQLRSEYRANLLKEHPDLLRACKRRLRTSQTRAARKAVPWDLILQDLIDTYPADGRCPVCSVDLVLRGPFGAETGVIDRIVPRLGYVRPNIRWLCNRCNIDRGRG